MENEEIPQSSEQPQATEKTYSVGLRPDVFSYIAEGLRPIYQAALMKVQQEGSFDQLQAFHQSRPAQLMSQVQDQFEDPHELPQNPTLRLTQADIKYLDEVFPDPYGVNETKHRALRFGQLREAYNLARSQAQQNKGLIERLRERFRR